MALTGGEVRLDRGPDGRVAYLTLSHGRYTVITWEMRKIVAERFAEIDRDHDVQVVVIRSDGEHFSSGGDIAGFMEVDPVDFTDLGHNVTAAARSSTPRRQLNPPAPTGGQPTSAPSITHHSFDPNP